MGIDDAATPAEDVIVVEGDSVWLLMLLGRVGDGGWERPPRCGMWSVGLVNSVAGHVRDADGVRAGGCELRPWKEVGRGSYLPLRVVILICCFWVIMMKFARIELGSKRHKKGGIPILSF